MKKKINVKKKKEKNKKIAGKIFVTFILTIFLMSNVAYALSDSDDNTIYGYVEGRQSTVDSLSSWISSLFSVTTSQLIGVNRETTAAQCSQLEGTCVCGGTQFLKRSGCTYSDGSCQCNYAVTSSCSNSIGMELQPIDATSCGGGITEQQCSADGLKFNKGEYYCTNTGSVLYCGNPPTTTFDNCPVLTSCQKGYRSTSKSALCQFTGTPTDKCSYGGKTFNIGEFYCTSQSGGLLGCDSSLVPYTSSCSSGETCIDGAVGSKSLVCRSATQCVGEGQRCDIFGNDPKCCVSSSLKCDGISATCKKQASNCANDGQFCVSDSDCCAATPSCDYSQGLGGRCREKDKWSDQIKITGISISEGKNNFAAGEKITVRVDLKNNGASTGAIIVEVGVYPRSWALTNYPDIARTADPYGLITSAEICISGQSEIVKAQKLYDLAGQDSSTLYFEMTAPKKGVTKIGGAQGWDENGDYIIASNTYISCGSATSSATPIKIKVADATSCVSTGLSCFSNPVCCDAPSATCKISGIDKKCLTPTCTAIGECKSNGKCEDANSCGVGACPKDTDCADNVPCTTSEGCSGTMSGGFCKTSKILCLDKTCVDSLSQCSGVSKPCNTLGGDVKPTKCSEINSGCHEAAASDTTPGNYCCIDNCAPEPPPPAEKCSDLNNIASCEDSKTPGGCFWATNSFIGLDISKCKSLKDDIKCCYNKYVAENPDRYDVKSPFKWNYEIQGGIYDCGDGYETVKSGPWFSGVFSRDTSYYDKTEVGTKNCGGTPGYCSDGITAVGDCKEGKKCTVAGGELKEDSSCEISATQITRTIKEFETATPSMIVQSTCSVPENCGKYTNPELTTEQLNNYIVTCYKDQKTEELLKDAYEKKCKKDLFWVNVLGQEGCLLGAVAGLIAAPATAGVSIIAVPLATCGAWGALELQVAIGCNLMENKAVDKGICIAKPKGGTTTETWKNFVHSVGEALGVDDSFAQILIIIAGIILLIIFMRMLNPPG